ncbi:hypothetical protein QCE63_28655 [Caballeronia sp. LZ065]|nr:hypothetical protein [Caballeronia sp. LZ065]
MPNSTIRLRKYAMMLSRFLSSTAFLIQLFDYQKTNRYPARTGRRLDDLIGSVLEAWRSACLASISVFTAISINAPGHLAIIAGICPECEHSSIRAAQ